MDLAHAEMVKLVTASVLRAEIAAVSGGGVEQQTPIAIPLPHHPFLLTQILENVVVAMV